jgi:hypothetical protein
MRFVLSLQGKIAFGVTCACFPDTLQVRLFL